MKHGKHRTKFASGFAALVALLAIGVAAPQPAAAQQPAASPPVRSPEYETAVRGLAEVMGSLYAYDAVCDEKVNDTWRINMQNLLDREGKPGAPIRVGMIHAFNEGYKAQQARYSSCTPAAKLSKNSLSARGGQLSRTLAKKNY